MKAVNERTNINTCCVTEIVNAALRLGVIDVIRFLTVSYSILYVFSRIGQKIGDCELIVSSISFFVVLVEVLMLVWPAYHICFDTSSDQFTNRFQVFYQAKKPTTILYDYGCKT